MLCRRGSVMKYSNVELCAMVDEFREFAAEPSWLEFKTGMKDPVQIAFAPYVWNDG